MSDHYDVIVIGSGAGGGTLTHALAPTGKKILLLERGRWYPRERDNWELAGRLGRAAVSQRRAVDRPARPPVQPQAALLRRRQHEGLRRRAVPLARARLRRRAPRRRHLTRVAAELRRLRAVVHQGRAALLRARRARIRSVRAAGIGAVPVAGRQPRAAHRTTRPRPEGRRAAPVPAAARDHARRGPAGGQRVHPLRDVRRVRLPRQGQGRRPGRVRRAGAAVPERVDADRRPRDATRHRARRPHGRAGAGRARRRPRGVHGRRRRRVRRGDQLGRPAAGIGQRRPPGWPRQQLGDGRTQPDAAQQLVADRHLQDARTRRCSRRRSGSTTTTSATASGTTRSGRCRCSARATPTRCRSTLPTPTTRPTSPPTRSTSG